MELGLKRAFDRKEQRERINKQLQEDRWLDLANWYKGFTPRNQREHAMKKRCADLIESKCRCELAKHGYEIE